VTANLKHFPAPALAPCGIEPLHPDEFVLQLIERVPARVLAAARDHRLAIAAGSGITPVAGLIRHFLAREPGSCFTLIYGNRRGLGRPEGPLPPPPRRAARAEPRHDACEALLDVGVAC
jgi:hypothetical protein